MQLQIKPGLRRVWREAGALQIGLSRRRGTVVSGLTAADVPLLEQLRDGVDAAVFEQVDEGLTASRRRELTSLLSSAGVLVGTGVDRPSRESLGVAGERLAPDAAVWSVVHPDVGDGWRLLADRSTRRVVISGAGRLGSTLATTLAAAGVGEITISDQRRVTSADLAPGGANPPDLGRLREDAVKDAVRRFGGRATTTGVNGLNGLVGPTGSTRPAGQSKPTKPTSPAKPTSATEPTAPVRPHGLSAAKAPRETGKAASGPPDRPVRPDLIVLIEHGAADANAAGSLVSSDQPHLSVVIREDDVVVGPLVRPGRGPCLRCLDLHRGDRDPAWPSVLAQVLRPAPGTPYPEETAASTLAAGLVALQVLAHLDGATEPASAGATLEIELPDGLIARRSWPAHPRCGCHWPPDPVESDPERATTGSGSGPDADLTGTSADQRPDRSLADARIRQLARTMGS